MSCSFLGPLQWPYALDPLSTGGAIDLTAAREAAISYIGTR